MRNVAQDRSCWAGQAMLFQRCGMSVFGVFARESAAGSGFRRDVLTPGVCEM